MKKGEKWQKKTTPKKRTKQRVLTEEIDGAIFLKAETANQAETSHDMASLPRNSQQPRHREKGNIGRKSYVGNVVKQNVK